MPWVYLLMAGVCEMVWPIGFKYTHGFTSRWWLVALTAGVMIFSFWLMSLATRGGIHVGTAYAVWTALGAAGTAVLGMILFNEPRDLMRMVCIGAIIAAVVGLKYLSPAEKPVEKPAFEVQTTDK